MKHIVRLFASLTLLLFVVASSNAQTATTVADKSEIKKCDVKKCDPAACEAMVKTGLCTKEEMAKCKAKCAAKSTKVAAATMEKGGATLVSEVKETKKASCVKTCTGKKKGKSE